MTPSVVTMTVLLPAAPVAQRLSKGKPLPTSEGVRNSSRSWQGGNVTNERALDYPAVSPPPVGGQDGVGEDGYDDEKEGLLGHLRARFGVLLPQAEEAVAVHAEVEEQAHEAEDIAGRIDRGVEKREEHRLGRETRTVVRHCFQVRASLSAQAERACNGAAKNGATKRCEYSWDMAPTSLTTPLLLLASLVVVRRISECMCPCQLFASILTPFTLRANPRLSLLPSSFASHLGDVSVALCDAPSGPLKVRVHERLVLAEDGGQDEFVDVPGEVKNAEEGVGNDVGEEDGVDLRQ